MKAKQVKTQTYADTRLNDTVRGLQNEIRIAGVFSTPHTFSEARDQLKEFLSEPILAKHLSRMVDNELLRKTDKHYELTQKGVQRLAFLKTHVKQLAELWKKKLDPALIKPDLLRYSISPTVGKIGTVRFGGLVQQWGSREIPQTTVDEAVKNLVNSLLENGLGTAKVDITIGFMGTVTKKAPP